MPPKSTMVVMQMLSNIFLECVPFHVDDNSHNRADKRPRRGLLSALYMKKLTYLQDPPHKIDFRIFGLKCVSDNSESISEKNIFRFLKKKSDFSPNFENFEKILSADFGSIFGGPGIEIDSLAVERSN